MIKVASTTKGRTNQRKRTRKDLLEAAARLIEQGKQPSLEEVAEEAMVGRATAYRYFPSFDNLLLEASLDIEVPSSSKLFNDEDPIGAIERLVRVNLALDQMILNNEAPLRMMLANSLNRQIGQGSNTPIRQNRRSPLIEAAIEPTRNQFNRDALTYLSQALALIIGTEGHIVCKDVLQINDDEASRMKRWAIEALVKAAHNGKSD